jgi:hypothetical protein
MDNVGPTLAVWKSSLLPSIQVGGLFARSKVAHKWKTPFRCLVLREAVFWRLHDLLTQSYLLHQHGHALGARILLRSAFESLATLIYLNQHMLEVIEGKLSFHVFGEKVSRLLIGSKIDKDGPESINILTVLKKCEKRYSGLTTLYGHLSESAHPSCEGLCIGYSTFNRSELETNFSNRWTELYGHRHLEGMELCMSTFHLEYNDVWAELFEKLEKWLEANDAELETTKNDPLPAQ